VVIISKTAIVEFGSKHPDSVEALNKWYEECKKANWNNFNEIKRAFNSVDYVGNDRYVFNINGNKYRLVAMIFLNIRTMFIRFIGTHAEYDKTDCTTV
jgi:mRNA interferase HigB